jgi:hypothetical protein
MKDLNYEHLTPAQQKTAKQIVDWLTPRIAHEGEQWIDGGGCNLFAGEFSYPTGGPGRYTENEVNAHLFLVYDGGGFYDMLSYNGEFEAHGIGYADQLMSFIESLGYTCEPVTSYCMAVHA